jgi:Domain of unknown function (DUF4436)
VGLAWRLLRQVVPLIVLAGLVAAGLVLYGDERDVQQQAYGLGDARSANRLDLTITVEKMNPAAQQLTMRVVAVPEGDLAAEAGSLVPSRAITLETTSLTTTMLSYPAGQPAAVTELAVDAPGIVTDYPLDRYHATIGFAAQADGTAIPVWLTLADTDPFFQVGIARGEDANGYASFSVTLTRSRSTLILAWLMMAIMWALALSVAAATRVLVRQRSRLIWPALGWMAATLFALAGFRNAAPGSPPIGSVLDYAAYLWAELIVAVSLVVTTAAGIRAERQPPVAPPPAVSPVLPA